MNRWYFKKNQNINKMDFFVIFAIMNIKRHKPSDTIY